ncbi:alpha/beta hydrolase [Actinosynnema sp. NPDC020468]|uniref:alpha/beta hydrolase n=1 Tax=Actinosynnema sp. NPDC020468 TaxID=3154488 RepID=UPI0033EA75B8
MRYSLAVGMAALLLTTALTPASAAPAKCREVDAPVSVLLSTQTVHGRLCVPAGGSSTVEVLIPGATYNSSYWDYSDGAHSFRAAQNDAGFATFTLDRLGTGRSSRPVAALLTGFVQAEAVHQVVTGLRSGAYGTSFGKVVVGGHSLGSAISVLVAGTWPDSVDGVLLTGLTHRINPPGVAAAFANFRPAELDVKFGPLFPIGYLTTAPGTRYASFHAPGVLTPELRAVEEATKDVFSPLEAADGLGVSVLLPYSLFIKAPVFLAVGQNDTAVCGALGTNCSTAATVRATEAPYFTSGLTTYVLPSYGHSINLAPNARDYYAAAATWMTSAVGR